MKLAVGRCIRSPSDLPVFYTNGDRSPLALRLETFDDVTRRSASPPPPGGVPGHFVFRNAIVLLLRRENAYLGPT